MTNLEKLRSMTAEEIATIIEKNEYYMDKVCMQITGSGECPHLDENDNVPDGVCKQCFINWLNSEAKQ